MDTSSASRSGSAGVIGVCQLTSPAHSSRSVIRSTSSSVPSYNRSRSIAMGFTVGRTVLQTANNVAGSGPLLE